MTLSASSILHYCDFGRGVIPTVGGDPHHSRNSSATWVDQRGVLQTRIVNSPRYEWVDLDGTGNKQQVLRLEQARTNLVVQSDLLTVANGWTVDGAIGVAAGTGPFAGRMFTRINGFVGVGGVSRTVTFTGDAVKAYSVLVKANGANTGDAYVGIYDSTAAAYIGRVLITVSAGGVISAVAQIGSLTGAIEPLADGVYRIRAVTSSATAAHTHHINAIGDAGAATLDSIHVSAVQVENGPCSSSIIPTASAVITRGADSFYWDFTPPPQASMFYDKFVERGTVALGCWAWEIGQAGGTTPRIGVYGNGTVYTVQHDNGSSAVSATLAAGPSYGDTVELVAVLAASGAVNLYQSINGGAASAAGLSGVKALAAAWSDTRLWLNSSGTNAPGCADSQKVKKVKYADVVGATAADIMAELRAFEIGANKQIL